MSKALPLLNTHGDGLDVSSSQVPSSFGPSTTPSRLHGPSRERLVKSVTLLSRFIGVRPGEPTSLFVQLASFSAGTGVPIVYISHVPSGACTTLGLWAKASTTTPCR